MTLLAMAAISAMAAVLLWAVQEKLRKPAALAETIRALGVPDRISFPAAIFTIAAEAGVAVALLFRPDSPLTQLGVMLLAMLFALAGLRALRLDERVPCSCFGAGSGRLGIPQIIALVPWLAGAAVVHDGARRPDLPAGAALFAAVALGIVAVRTMAVLQTKREARADRLSAQEMYKWLPSH
ncbi:MAG TPA: MauE/DoxX family redox-associated membrane protein [Thermoanaerobaculia bacterium]|nr:MauE/DoxX family redox-associated membrane protein [Thermoanaerobaculia bacterium]